jgi:mercuric ion transport protein
MNIQLIYARDCPNIGAARAALLRSLEAEGLPMTFEEMDTAEPATPAHLRDWGSPTILVDGLDVGGEAGPMGPCCRLYDHGTARRGIPSEAVIRAALRRARTTTLLPAQ